MHADRRTSRCGEQCEQECELNCYRLADCGWQNSIYSMPHRMVNNDRMHVLPCELSYLPNQSQRRIRLCSSLQLQLRPCALLDLESFLLLIGRKNYGKNLIFVITVDESCSAEGGLQYFWVRIPLYTARCMTKLCDSTTQTSLISPSEG